MVSRGGGRSQAGARTSSQLYSAQPSTAFVKRLAELETLTSTLSSRLEAQQQLLAAQAKQIEALEGTVTGQALTINTLRTALDAEVNNRSDHVDIAVNNALIAARQYTDSKTNPLIDKLVHISRNGNNVYITGANLHVRHPAVRLPVPKPPEPAGDNGLLLEETSFTAPPRQLPPAPRGKARSPRSQDR